MRGHRNLGVHTEMFSDGVMDLIHMGVINGECKNHFRKKVVASFAMGTQDLYNYMHENQGLEMLESHIVNVYKIAEFI